MLAATGWLLASPVAADPQWLLRGLPGVYPEVVYFVPTDEPAIALTIDDGPDPETTPAILDVLQANGASATFFLLSDAIAGNEELVRRIVAEGHELGHHMTADEVSARLDDVTFETRFLQAHRVLESFGGAAWFRPGSGRYNDHMRELAERHGYRIALASVPPLDTVLDDPQRMAGLANWWAEPGSILVLHDRGDRGHRTAATLELLLPRMADAGLAVTTLGKLDKTAKNQ
jgi:peptidoglycan/xylan/chitin deacetylase (PgdA/CDA1 family)